MMRSFQLLPLAILFACASTPPLPPAPAWVAAPTRVVDGGYIVYVGYGEDANSERAYFKAESIAIQDVANECSFAPKGTRIEDHFDQSANGWHKVYAKVALTFEECERAKKAIDPDAIRELASVPMAEQVKRYQSELGEAAMSPQNAVVASGSGNLSTNGNPSYVTPLYAGPIDDEPHFYVVRQEVFYQKQVVILAPPGTYVANSPEAKQVTSSLAPTTGQLQSFENQHPAVRMSPNTWSNYGSRQARLRTAHPMMNGPRNFSPNGMRPPHNGNSRGRFRRSNRTL